MQAPAGVPDSCPFETEWVPAIFVVQVGQNMDEMAIKQKLLASQACKCMHMVLESSNAEAHPDLPELKASIQQARSEQAPGTNLPPDILRQLCELRWNTDKENGWQQEWGRRQEASRAAATALEV